MINSISQSKSMYPAKSTHIGDIIATAQIKSIYPTKGTHIGDIIATAKVKGMNFT